MRVSGVGVIDADADDGITTARIARTRIARTRRTLTRSRLHERFLVEDVSYSLGVLPFGAPHTACTRTVSFASSITK